jgi:hypothetical protein
VDNIQDNGMTEKNEESFVIKLSLLVGDDGRDQSELHAKARYLSTMVNTLQQGWPDFWIQ